MTRKTMRDVHLVTQGAVTLKVYQVNRGERTIFSVSDREHGRRRLRQFGRLEKALGWAATRAKELDRGKNPSVTLSNVEGAIYERAKKLLAPTGRAIDQVASEYAEVRAILGDEASLKDAAIFFAERRLNISQRSVPEIVEELLRERSHKSVAYVRDIRQRLRRFAKSMTGPISSVTRGDLTAWLRAQGGSPRNHDNFRQALVTLFRFAQRQGYLPDGKTEAEKTEAKDSGDDGEIGIFTPDEMRRLLVAARPDVRPFLVLGAFAGIRTAEIKRLDWSEINFDTSYIEIKKAKAKTRGRRLIKMQPNLVEWLKHDRKTSGPVTLLARPEKTASEVVCRATKAPEQPAVVWKRNGLRHSYCTYRMAVVQNEHIVSSEMGNSPAMVHKNYRELATLESGLEWFSVTDAILPIRASVGVNS
jgi:integrase